MGRAVKIGVVGAGSAVYALGLVRDLCLAEHLYGSRVTFMDIDPERLEVVGQLANRYAEEMGVDLAFETTGERAVALRDADFVINTALAGGHGWEESWRHEAEKLGYYRGLRLQTNFHQYDLMLSLVRDMEELCPDAWLIQSSNPLFEGCTLMTRESPIEVVGLCHGFWGYRRLAEAIGVPSDEVQWQAVGVNHWIYLTQFRHQGVDLYPRIDQWIESESEDYWHEFRGGYGETQLSRAAIDHYLHVGLMPIGDASRTFSEWYYHTDLETKRRWYGYLGGFDSQIGWSRYLDRLAERVQHIHDVALDPGVRVTDAFPPERTHELQVPVMDAIANDRPGVYQVNVPNRGAIENIADDVVVEGKALVDGAGVHLLHVGPLPEKLMYTVLYPRVLKAEKELATYLSGDRDMLLSCVLDDHQTRSLEQAQQAVYRLLCLPWNEPLAERFGHEPLECDLGEYDLPDVDEIL